MYLTLEKVKQHLNIEASYIDDDNYIYSLIEVAESVVENHINYNLSDLTIANGDVLPTPLQHAMLLFISHLYSNREAVSINGKANEMPLSYSYLLDMYKNYNF